MLHQGIAILKVVSGLSGLISNFKCCFNAEELRPVNLSEKAEFVEISQARIEGSNTLTIQCLFNFAFRSVSYK